MKSADLRICIVGGNSKPATIEKHLKEINDSLAHGYELYGPPIALSDNRIVYNLLKPAEKERIDFKSAYPTDRQLGYLQWAFNVQGFDLETLNLTKQESSQLITFHKEDKGGRQCKKRHLIDKLMEIRGGEGVSMPNPDDKEDKEYTDEMPF